MRVHISLLLFIIISLSSCSKDSGFSNPEVVVSKEGLLRVECANCEVNYRINNKDFSVSVNESNDIPFYYTGDFNLKTEVVSKEEQNIRILVIDSFGRVVSNELSSKLKGEVSKKEFAIVTR
ncbi:hypothetical protein [Pedobacter sp. B4-66]|uniref:hypothetical protein n=1 Tax=Pedobacter sp. B4-66 TaxID=2817280 RepID=UPI001BD9D01B|nr:hypothetical protein [Pedobacter sp. B4-66]